MRYEDYITLCGLLNFQSFEEVSTFLKTKDKCIGCIFADGKMHEACKNCKDKKPTMI